MCASDLASAPTPGTRPEQARRGLGHGRSHLAECERGNAAASPRGTRGYPGRPSPAWTNLGTEPRRPASPASLLARVCRVGATSSACCAPVAARRGGRGSPGRPTHHSRKWPVRRLQRQQLDGQRRSRRALLRLAKRASPRRRRSACSFSSDSGVFSAPAAMPAPRASGSDGLEYRWCSSLSCRLLSARRSPVRARR